MIGNMHFQVIRISNIQYQIGTPEETEHSDLVTLSLLSKNVYQRLILSHKRSLPTVLMMEKLLYSPII